MSGIALRLLLIVAFLLFFSPTGNSIECYECDGINNEDCNDPFNITIHKSVHCNNENFVCVKQNKLNKEQNRTYLHRGCIQKHYCEILAKASDFCITCTTNFCNGTVRNLPIASILLVAILPYYFM